MFHEKRVVPSILALAHTAFKLMSKRARVILIAGNHDVYGKFVTFQTFDFATIVKEPYVEEIDGVRIAFVPYIKEPSLLPDADIVFGHFAVCDLKCKARDSNITTADLTKYRRVILGHEHKHGVFTGTSYHITYLGASIANTFADLDVVPSYFIFQNGNLTRCLLDMPRYLSGTSDIAPEDAENNYVRIYTQPGESVSFLRKRYEKAKFVEFFPLRQKFEPKDFQKVVSVDIFEICKEFAKNTLKKDIPDDHPLFQVLREVLNEAQKS